MKKLSIRDLTLIVSFFSLIFSSPPRKIINLSNYNYPKPLSSPFLERIAILGTNDIHGHILPTIEFIPANNETYRTGGLTLMSSYIDALKEEWGENLLWLDAGDEYQGTLESNTYYGESITKFFNYKNLTGRTGAAIGNHDFDFGIEQMINQFNISDFPHLAANIYNKTENAFWNIPNTFPSHIFKVGSLKVGVIGLTTLHTPQTTATDTSDLIFKELANVTIEQSKNLRSNGADIVLLVCHVGVGCKNGNTHDIGLLKLRNKTSNPGTYCSESDELYEFLNQIPSETLDGVIGGHKHTIVHHWLNDIPVVVGGSNARHFNVLYLTYDKLQKKVIKEFTKIEGPVPVCETLFHFQRTCYSIHTEKILDANVAFYNLSFHDKIIEEDLGMKNLLHPYLEIAEKLKSNIIGYIANPMVNSNDDESEMGNFVADALRNHTNADVVLLNRGMMRINWQQGAFSYYDLYETFPFEDEIVSFEVTGSQLISIVKILQEGYLGFYISSGIKQNVCKDPHSLINVTMEYDEEIIKDKLYKVATIKFMLNGGDDFADVLKFFTFDKYNVYDNVREVIAEYMRKYKVLNVDEHRFIDPNNRRLVVHDCKKIELPIPSHSKILD